MDMLVSVLLMVVFVALSYGSVPAARLGCAILALLVFGALCQTRAPIY